MVRSVGVSPLVFDGYCCSTWTLRACCTRCAGLDGRCQRSLGDPSVRALGWTLAIATMSASRSQSRAFGATAKPNSTFKQVGATPFGL